MKLDVDVLFVQPQTRQGSDVNIVGNPTGAAGVTTRSQSLAPVVLGGRVVTGDLFESYNVVDEFEKENGKLQEESMRVMYEDPGQRDEKKRLMSLLKNGEDDGLEKRTRRRSTRIAGF